MALSRERLATMRVFAETAAELGETVPVGPKTLLELLDQAERTPFATIRTREMLDHLPDNTVIVANDGILVAYHKRIFPDGTQRWWTTAEARVVGRNTRTPTHATR